MLGIFDTPHETRIRGTLLRLRIPVSRATPGSLSTLKLCDSKVESIH